MTDSADKGQQTEDSARRYTAQHKDGYPKRPWTIAKDGETSTDTDHPWSVVTYRTKAEAEAAIHSHKEEVTDSTDKGQQTEDSARRAARVCYSFPNGLPTWMYMERDGVGIELDEELVFGDVGYLLTLIAHSARINLAVWSSEALRIRGLLRSERQTVAELEDALVSIKLALHRNLNPDTKMARINYILSRLEEGRTNEQEDDQQRA